MTVSRLPHLPAPPLTVTGSAERGRHGRWRMRLDAVVLGSGDEASHLVIESPDSAFVVPLFEDGSTILVRQWRHPWAETSWEVPAGTLEEGEDPLLGARRELEEEAGLRAGRWTPLGVTRASAALTNHQHLFLARELEEVERAPELYEQDMIVTRLPFEEALAEALSGGIQHAGSIAALSRAARNLKKL